jgi:DtxR family Mn-dependent transcriptional regulator
MHTATVSATSEDYLEAILRLDAEKGAARVRDISAALSVHKSTVSLTLKSLAGKGLIEYAPYETTRLTPEGRRIAEGVSASHRAIKRFLTDVLMVDEGTAGRNACRMEHAMDRSVVARLVSLNRYLAESSGPDGVLSGFRTRIAKPGAGAPATAKE